jgi:prepilin-type N-terminal cleavage/methylation domain-containing protein
MRTSAHRVGQDERGFTLLELMAVVTVFVITVAMAVTPTVTAIRSLRISTDRRAIATIVALARMRAAAGFTQSRVYADLAGRRFRLQVWKKTSPTTGLWVTEGGDVMLHTAVEFGVGSLADAPANTQAALGQAPLCTDETGAAIADTACMLFNSRSIPVDGAGAPTPNGALWVTNATEVHGVTVSATGLTQSWSAPLGGSTHAWRKH